VTDPVKRLHGIYRGVVETNVDPKNQRRIQVKTQTTGNEITDWVWPVEPANISTEVPVIGQGVWVSYVGGDPEYPVWHGAFGKNQGKSKKILIKSLANSVSLVGLTAHIIVIEQPDGTSEVDLTSTLMALANKVKVLEGKVTVLEGKVTTLEAQILTKASTSHTHP
jgi:hypothetical protein